MWDIVGQDKAVTFLQKSLLRGSLAHAYLLVGPPHVGKMALAVNIAMAINCEAPEPPCGKCASCQRIAAGKQADILILSVADYRHLGYRFGANLVDTVIKKGVIR